VKLQNLDRRVLYALLAATISFPLVVKGVPLPKPAVTPTTIKFHDTIEEIAADPARKDKLVIVSCNFGSGTLAENLSQTEAVLTHICRRGMRFAIFAFNDPQGRELGGKAAEKIAARFNYKYGENWVNWGYRPAAAIQPLLKAAVNDIPGTFRNDVKGTKLQDVPVMRGVKTTEDIGLIVEMAASNTLPVWIQFFQRAGKTPIATLYCPTSVMASEAYPYLDSGQLQGMLVGLKGASEYEARLGETGFGTQASASLSYSHVLIIGLIVLGNVGMFAERRRREGRRP